MTETHPTDDALQEWLDGEAPPEEARRLDAHVAGCARCGAEVERLREILSSLRSLPRSMAPPERVRTGARRRIAAGGDPAGADAASSGDGEVVAAIGRAGDDRGRRIGLAAAAVALVLIGAAAGALLGPPSRPGTPAPAAGDPAAAAFRAVSGDYDHAVAELEAELAARRGEIDPATARIVEDNLRLVDRAIREARAALAADPADPILRDLIVAGYEQKLDLLRRALPRPVEL